MHLPALRREKTLAKHSPADRGKNAATLDSTDSESGYRPPGDPQAIGYGAEYKFPKGLKARSATVCPSVAQYAFPACWNEVVSDGKTDSAIVVMALKTAKIERRRDECRLRFRPSSRQ